MLPYIQWPNVHTNIALTLDYFLCVCVCVHTPANKEIYAEVTILREDHQHQEIVKIETFNQQPIVTGPNTVLHQDLDHTTTWHYLQKFLGLLPSGSLMWNCTTVEIVFTVYLLVQVSVDLFLYTVYLVTKNNGNILVVSELRCVFHEKSISRKDGQSSQDEWGKQVGVDVITCATKLPMILHTNTYSTGYEIKNDAAV